MKNLSLFTSVILLSLAGASAYGSQAAFLDALRSYYARIDRVCNADAEKTRLACVEKVGNTPLCQQEADKAKSKCEREIILGERRLTGRE